MSGAQPEAPVRRALRRLSDKRIFFAHQSVGANLMAGVNALAREHPEIAPHVAETLDPVALSRPRWIHGRIGSNGQPLLKLAELRLRVEQGIGAKADVVLFKLCYADITAHTDVNLLHRAVGNTFRDLASQFPRTTFAITTVPLTTVQHGARAHVKCLLGLSPGGALENARRSALNALLLGGPFRVFDLARLESVDARGRRAVMRTSAGPTALLAEANTHDGGHLTPEASVRIARELITFLAEL